MELSKTESVRQAQQLIDQGRWSSAISIYQKIVEADPLDLAAISVLSDLYIKAGRIQEAVEHFLRIAENYVRRGSGISAAHLLKKVIKLDPASARAHMNLGELSAREGKLDQAHDYFIEAGAAFWHKGNTAAAIRMNERALASMPNSRQAKTALSVLQQEIDQPELPSTPKPITGELEPILISIPDDPNEMGAAAAVEGKQVPPEWPSESSQPAPPPESLLPLDDDLIPEQIARAELLVGQGQIEQAITLLRSALHISPDHIAIRETIKDIYLRSEMVDRASEECLNIAGIYAARGESSRARGYVMRARLLRDSADQIAPETVLQKSGLDEDEEAQEDSLAWTPDVRHPVAVM